MQKTPENQSELVKEIKLLKERVAELENMKKEFLSDASHELRTPLSIIKEGLNLVLDQIPGKINDEQAKILKAAKSNINRLAEVINKFLRCEGGKNGR